MSDVFISYARDDQAIAELFAKALEADGLTVWWDAALRSGEAYDEVIEAALKRAKAVVVLWSAASVASRWVRAEATLADRAKTLAPVIIEPCDLPIMFELDSRPPGFPAGRETGTMPRGAPSSPSCAGSSGRARSPPPHRPSRPSRPRPETPGQPSSCCRSPT